jgi:hypothetical protein
MPDAIAEVVSNWRADDLRASIAGVRACGSTMLPRDEWLSHRQAAYLAGRPAVEIERAGEAPARSLLPAGHPLSGIRVLDFTCILAGPISGRCLAEHGADVLMVTAANLPQTPSTCAISATASAAASLTAATASSATASEPW